MRNRRTYFEQVPIKEVVAVLQKDAESVASSENTTTLVPVVKRRPISRKSTHKSNASPKGKP